MLTIAKEVVYLVLALTAGTYVCCAIAGHLLSRLGLYFVASPLPLWTTVLATPLGLYFHSKYYWLHETRIHGCKPAPVYPHRDPILGIDWITTTLHAVRQNIILQTWDGFFQTVGNTFWAQNIGAWILMTNEPENVKALLSTQFETWPIAGLRQKVLIMALGPKGIFSVNGKEWQDARAMIRPSFVRNQIADLECTDRHVENFLGKIPKNGERVDLQDLLYMFTMDVSTDFM